MTAKRLRQGVKETLNINVVGKNVAVGFQQSVVMEPGRQFSGPGRFEGLDGPALWVWTTVLKAWTIVRWAWIREPGRQLCKPGHRP